MIFLKNLHLTEFKNHATASFDFASKLNSLVGLNGVGKTNILDAIHVLCLTKSHFMLPDAALMKHGADFFRVEGFFEKSETKETIVAKMAIGKRKAITRNGAAYSRAAEHIGLLPTVMLSPDDPYLLLDGSEERRSFLDKAISQGNPIYLQYLTTYQKLLDQRNAFLKAAIEQGLPPNQALLTVYNTQLLAPAAYIYSCRKAFTTDFTPIFQGYYAAISGGKEVVSCVYESQLHEKELALLLEETHRKDCVLGRTTTGTHKDDLVFFINDFPLKRYASQGQLKSYILALKLAQSECLRRETGFAPILLLDDIFDKLDAKRVAHLLQLLHQPNFGQLFVTDTDPRRVASIAQSITTDFKQFEL